MVSLCDHMLVHTELNITLAHSPAPDGGPVAWFQSPGVPGNGPNPQLETYIYQGEGKQEGSGPVGVAWTPSNPSPGEPSNQWVLVAYLWLS